MRLRQTRRRILVALLLALTWPAGTASAYVRAVTSLGVPVWWRNPRIAMDIYLGAPPPILTADQCLNAGKLAAQAWSHGDIACTSVSLDVRESAGDAADIGLDLKNVIVFRQGSWCSSSDTTDLAPDTCYPSNAMAVTTLFKNKTTGEILDADMEINAVDFNWGDLSAGTAQTGTAIADLQNTLTHELGHVIGLAHNCYTPDDGPTPLFDNTGNPEVSCADPNLPTAITDATMYPEVPVSDTQRRTLSPDDQQATCDIYPSGHGSGGGPSGCNVAGTGPAARSQAWSSCWAWPLALAALVLAYRRPRSGGADRRSRPNR